MEAVSGSRFFEEVILSAFPLSQWRSRRVCLATSGGADSVALLLAMTRLATRFGVSENLFVVTVDHGTRNGESTLDAQFVLDLCAELGTRGYLARVDAQELAYESKRLGSWESGARAVRYRLLQRLAKEHSARFLLTAHHQDDQVETLLFRIFRGSGLTGLRGISRCRALDEALVLVRPMLTLSREEILAYLSLHGQRYRTDSTNASSAYKRNRIRNELTPQLTSIFGATWRSALLRLASNACEIEEYLESEIHELEEKIARVRRQERAYARTLQRLHAPTPSTWTHEETARRIVLPLSPLDSTPEPLLRIYLRRVWRGKNWTLGAMGNREWRRLSEAILQRQTPHQTPGNVMLTYPDAEHVVITKAGDQ
ncbi:MAG: tRNA lysidine(34) synthetase TilS [Planctomycetia bacterium]|nr:tRNA lysidine(34) synthetase TilS [Planctomycetia bacterium]